MRNSKLKKILSELPVFDKEPDCSECRTNPLKLVHLSLITQRDYIKTEQGRRYHVQDLAAVVGRDSDSSVIYFSRNSLSSFNHRTMFAYETEGEREMLGIHYVSVSAIKSYEILKKL